MFKSFSYILSLLLVLSSIPFYGTNEVTAQEDDRTSVSGGDKTNSEKKTDSNSSAILKEIPELRNANSKVFLNEEGFYVAEVYLEPIHYKKNKQWIDIDNTLVSSKDNQSFKNTDNEFEVNFPKKPFQQDETELFTYETKGHEMQIDLVTNDSETLPTEGTKDIIPTVNENQILLEEPLNDVNFEYIVEGSKVKENIILNSYQGRNTFEFELNVKNLEAKKQTDGSIHFFDQNGEFVFLIERPYMYDSNTKDGPEGVISQNVEQEIVKTENGYLLTITADEVFLTDPKRVYPVTIDPWIDVNQAEDTFVSSSSTSNYSNTDYLSVGYNATLGMTRSLLKFNLPTIPNGEVSDAKLLLNQITDTSATQVNVHQVTSPYSTTTVTWANQPKFKSEQSGKNQNSAKGEAAFSITDTVKEWYESPSTNYGLLLKYPDSIEGSSLRKTYYSSESTNSLSTKPTLKVTYRPLELLGLTDYWTYTPDNFQGEGTAVVNVINGNMVYDIPLLNLPGKTDAFKLALTYNSLSYYNYHYGFSWMFNAHESILTNADNSIIEYRSEGGGRYHFTKLEDGSYRSPEGYEGNELTRTSNGFELKDSNESIRYFDNLGRNYEIKDENGNRIVYTYENSSSSRVTKITELTGSTETGRSIALAYKNGYLSSVTDFNGNITSLVYGTVAGRNVLENVIYAKGSSTEKTIEFSYDPNTARLVAVKDANGNLGKIEYDPVTQRVMKLIDPRSDEIFSSLEYGEGYTIYKDSNGNKTRYAYSSSESKDTTNVTEITENYETNLSATWKYVWEKNRIVSTTEPDQMTGLTPDAATTTATYNDNGELLTLNTTGNQSLALERTDEKNNITSTTDSSLVENYLTYDAFSNLISTSNNMELTDYNQYDKYGNITQSASPTSGNYNRLQNSQFEKIDTTYPTGWSRYNGTGAGTHQSSSISYTGNRSAQITLSDTETAGYYSQQFPVEATDTTKNYTVSAQVKTDKVNGEGARIRVYPLDSSKVNIKDGNGMIISYLSQPLTGTLDWTQLSETFNLPANTAHVRVDLLFKGTGTVYFDAVQATNGETLDQYALNENTSLELGSGTTATNWTLNALGTGDGRTNTMKKYGSYAMRLTGTSTANRYMGQAFDMKGKKGDFVTFSGWGSSTSTSPGGNFKLRLWLVFADGTEKSYDSSFTPNIIRSEENSWQFTKSTVLAEKDFVQAKIYAIYGERTGVGYFDNIKVVQNGSVSTKTYSNEGTFIDSETDTLGYTTKYEYDANGNETKEIDATGNVKSRTYDEHDRLKSVSIGSGSNLIQTNYQFDTQGNLLNRINPLGYETSFIYNNINAIEGEIDPLDKYSYYEYDGEGNIKKIERGQDSTISSIVTFEYDAANNESSKSVNGTKYYDKTYYRNNLLKSIQMSNGDVYSYEYDTSKRLTKASSPNYSIENRYGVVEEDNSNGLRGSYIETSNGKTFETKYTYDNLQRLSALTTHNGKNYQYYFNESSQPESVFRALSQLN